ncbi:MAG: hypothetical protein JJU06_02055 [Ectothiorhodospiraceae bacterium]|nr:hypothetical protein [Ectothiorhodospiraceae bacterium]MCH8503305.1 hypothetical protein [Ectothiorhodospiraceae bacterium]
MPKSVRVSDELYQKLEHESQIMHRSLGAQLEYLARLGLAVEQSPHLSARDLHALLSSVEPTAQTGGESLEDLFSRLSHLDGNPVLMEQLKARGDTLEVIEEKVSKRPRRQRKAG